MSSSAAVPTAAASAKRPVHVQVAMKLDDLFSEYLALYEQIRAERTKANEQIKQGHFKLSECRHSLPTCPLDSTSYSGRPMLPLHGVLLRDLDTASRLSEEQRNNAQKGEVSFELAKVEFKQGEEGELDEDIEWEKIEKKEKEAELRQRGTGAKAKDGADAASPSADAADSTSSSTDSSSTLASLDLRSDPLKWFGALVPPALPDVATSFQESLGPLLAIASHFQQMQRIERRYKYLTQLQSASFVDPDAEEELKQLLEKIALDDKKPKPSAAVTASE